MPLEKKVLCFSLLCWICALWTCVSKKCKDWSQNAKQENRRKLRMDLVICLCVCVCLMCFSVVFDVQAKMSIDVSVEKYRIVSFKTDEGYGLWLFVACIICFSFLFFFNDGIIFGTGKSLQKIAIWIFICLYS